MPSDGIRYAYERFVSRGKGKPGPVGKFFRSHPTNLTELSLKVGCRNSCIG